LTNQEKYARITRMSERIRLEVYSPDLLTIEQASKRFGKHLATVYRWIEKGRIFPFHIGEQIYLTVEQVDRFKKELEAAEANKNSKR
jgi:excisionase family DNA binding protein